jgi:hypothetical protein
MLSPYAQVLQRLKLGEDYTEVRPKFPSLSLPFSRDQSCLEVCLESLLGSLAAPPIYSYLFFSFL